MALDNFDILLIYRSAKRDRRSPGMEFSQKRQTQHLALAVQNPAEQIASKIGRKNLDCLPDLLNGREKLIGHLLGTAPIFEAFDLLVELLPEWGLV